MSGTAVLLVGLFLSLGPGGSLLHPQLAAVDTDYPTTPLLDVVPRLWLVMHENPSLQMAFYAPPGSVSELGLGGADADGVSKGISAFEARLAADLLGVEPRRLLPGLDVPRLVLYRPYYRDATGFVAVERMTVDLAEHYFNALWEAWLDLGLAQRPEIEATLDERAMELMQSVPEASRREAYRSALGDFASHAFSVAGELRRSRSRARAAGRDICPAVRLPTTLYGLWGRIFNEHGYQGSYFVRPASGGQGRWRMSREVLGREDKELVRQEIWDGLWSGDVRRDFAIECPVLEELW